MFPVISQPKAVLDRVRFSAFAEHFVSAISGPRPWVNSGAKHRAASLPAGGVSLLCCSYAVVLAATGWHTLRTSHPLAGIAVAAAVLSVVAPEALEFGAQRTPPSFLLGGRAWVRVVGVGVVAVLGAGCPVEVVALAGVFGVEAAVTRHVIGGRRLGSATTARLVALAAIGACIGASVGLFGALLAPAVGPGWRSWLVAGSAGGLASVVAFVVGERCASGCIVRSSERERRALAQQRKNDLRDLATWMHDEVANPLRLLRLRLADGSASLDTIGEELDRLELSMREGQLDRLLEAGVSCVADLAQPSLRRAERFGLRIVGVPSASTSATVIGGPDGRLVAQVIAGFIGNAVQAGASAISLRVSLTSEAVAIEVDDDAGGFAWGPEHAGRGLDALRRALADHNGDGLLGAEFNGGPSFITTPIGTVARAVIRRTSPPIG